MVAGAGAEAHFVEAKGAGGLTMVAVAGEIIRRVEVGDGEEESRGDAAERGKVVAIGEIDRSAAGERVQEDAGDGGVFLEVVAAGKVGGHARWLVRPGDDGDPRKSARRRKILAVGEARHGEVGGRGGVWTEIGRAHV